MALLQLEDWLPSVSLPVQVSTGSPSGLTWLLYKCACCGGQSMALLQLEDPLELVVKGRDFLPVPCLYFVAIYDLNC